MPTFKFAQTGLTRTRTGGGLRVFVERGWFASGEDERLAVLVAMPNLWGTGVEQLHSSISVWGDDPIWVGQTKITPLDRTHFVVDPSMVVTNLPLADGTGTVDAVTFTPQFSAEKQAWYFDIELKTDQSYFPFIRLAIARYQPGSLNTGIALSRVVLADFAQLAADRTASVVASGNNYAVTVSGPMASNVALGTAPSAATLTSGRAMTVMFQEAVNKRGDAVDWKQVGSQAPLLPVLSGSSAVFQGNIAYPIAAKPGARHRILIREYELYGADDQDGVKAGSTILHAGSTTATPYQQRLVYADAIEIMR
jgi:hypothetical protein